MIVSTIKTLTETEKELINKKLGRPVIYTSDIQDLDVNDDKIKVLITFGHDINEAILNRFVNLEWIHIFQTGIEHLNVQEIIGRDITLTHTKDIHGVPISEYVLSMILYEVRNIQKYEFAKLAHLWDRREKLPTEAAGRTVGIFGTGLIGQDIARLLKAIGMKTLGVNTRGNQRPYFDEVYAMKDKNVVLKCSDFIILILPLTPETLHCINKEEFELMKETTYLINVGRGPLINTAALVEAIETKQISGAALDVFDEEPLPMDSPLWSLDNVFITPHIASSTDMYNKRAIEKFVENYIRFLGSEQMLNEITSEEDY